MVISPTRVGLALLLLAACPPQDPSGPATGSSGGSSGSGDPTGGDPTTDPTEGSTGGSTGSSTGPAPMCEVTPDQTPCAQCSNTNCCAPIEACQAEPACDCMTNCVTGLDDIAMCTQKCGTSTNFSPLTMCTLLNCAAECT